IRILPSSKSRFELCLREGLDFPSSDPPLGHTSAFLVALTNVLVACEALPTRTGATGSRLELPIGTPPKQPTTPDGPSPRKTGAGAFCGDPMQGARKSSPNLATLCQLSVSNNLRFCGLV